MKTLKCSYCGRLLGNSYSFNSIFIKPTLYRCKRWRCNLATKRGYVKIHIEILPWKLLYYTLCILLHSLLPNLYINTKDTMKHMKPSLFLLIHIL